MSTSTTSLHFETWHGVYSRHRGSVH